MPSTAPDPLYVVVGVVTDARGFLIQQRTAGQVAAGLWEFAGGKREVGETPRQALAREMAEELGITVDKAKPLTQLRHDYPHAKVLLDVYLITQFHGEPRGCEGQLLAWKSLAEIRPMAVLEAVPPLLDALETYFAANQST